jgi:endonuclease/exonuclease/phosphatase family metal-dependent hydrolase
MKIKIRGIARTITLVLAVLLVALVIFYFWAGSGTLSPDKLSWIKSYRQTAHAPAAAPPDTFRLMTYNIGYLSAMANNLPVRKSQAFFEANMNRFLTFLKETPIDIIAFQEIDFDSHRSYHMDQPQTIALEACYSYAAGAVNWDKRYVPFPYWPPSAHFRRLLSGQAVLSRYPIRSAERLVLAKVRNKPFFWRAFYLDRLAQVVHLRLPGHTLVVINVHLEAFDRQTRQIQAAEVLDIYRAYKGRQPVLLVGDFNCVPPGTDYTQETTIRLFLQEESLKPVRLDAPTFPASAPDRQLDYIFYTHQTITPVAAYTAAVHSSDHLPLVMEFRFNG